MICDRCGCESDQVQEVLFSIEQTWGPGIAYKLGLAINAKLCKECAETAMTRLEKYVHARFPAPD